MRNFTVQRKWFASSNFLWNNKESLNFAEIVTRYGIGFAFNLLEDFKLYNLENVSNDFRFNYKATGSSRARPWKTGIQGDSGLRATFYEDDKIWIRVCRGNGVIVHSPFEPASHTSRFTALSYNKDVKILISLEIFQADDDLRSLAVDQRKCFFDDERKLTYFKVYTKNNCEAECLSFIGKPSEN
jgi:hypothetical protein